jgi:predicted CXXCH cytochrome family protein
MKTSVGGRANVALLLPLVLLIALSEPVADAATPNAPTPVRQADAVCASCHREIFNKYLKTFMANASGVALDRWLPGSYHEPGANIDYQFAQQNGAAWMSFSRAGYAGLTGKHELSYFLGSGHLGLTYLYSTDGYLFETPAAYYAKLNGYDMKPGIGDGARMPPGLPMSSGCMRCHMSDVRREDAGTENRYTGLPFQHGGITCESCHGATEQHVATHGRAAAVLNPIKLEPERRDSVCISCHLEGDTHIERLGKRALDYRPGDRISDYMTFFQYGSPDATSRGVSEIEQLNQSTCKRTSGDRMSCMSCHDPHFSPAAEDRASFYRNKCLGCHTAPKFATAHFSNNPDCTSCHMPKSSAENIPHVAWTDHRILRQPAETAREGSKATTPPALTSILKGEPSERDLALGYYDLVTTGHIAERERALELLRSAVKLDGGDQKTRLALGIMLQWSKDTSAAEQEYRRVLQLDPLNLIAAVNLGTLLAQAGQLQAAVDLWNPAFDRNKNNVTLGSNLATVQCLLGRKDDSLKILRTILIYNPDEQKVLGALHSLESKGDSCSVTKPT